MANSLTGPEDPSELKQDIETFVASQGQTSLNRLSEAFDVNLATLFKLTDELVDQGRLVRVNSFTFRTPGPLEEPPDEDEADGSEKADGMAGAEEAASVRPEDAPSPSFKRGSGAEGTAAEASRVSAKKERMWGTVLILFGLPFLVVAGAVFFSVWVGGIFGILSVEVANAVGVLVGLLGLIGLVQGARAIRGRDRSAAADR